MINTKHRSCVDDLFGSFTSGHAIGPQSLLDPPERLDDVVQ